MIGFWPIRYGARLPCQRRQAYRASRLRRRRHRAADDQRRCSRQKQSPTGIKRLATTSCFRQTLPGRRRQTRRRHHHGHGRAPAGARRNCPRQAAVSPSRPTKKSEAACLKLPRPDNLRHTLDGADLGEISGRTFSANRRRCVSRNTTQRCHRGDSIVRAQRRIIDAAALRTDAGDEADAGFIHITG